MKTPAKVRQATLRKTALCAVFSALCGLGALYTHTAQAFCGFYVGKADASLYNKASKVIIARDGDRQVISMQNDYQGPLSEFAMVVPVPSVLSRDQIHVGNSLLFDRVDAYSAPRLTEYYDENPCAQPVMAMRAMAVMDAAPMEKVKKTAENLGVKVEATYTIGEYDIVLLSAQQSGGLAEWLTQSGYKLPAGLDAKLEPYIKQNMKFFVAKVNLGEQAKTGFKTLRPIQFAFDSKRFMLPIRLGMVNATQAQDLIIYVLSRQGRVEAANYRTIKMPANVDLPLFIRKDFGTIYKQIFQQQWEKEDKKVVFTEYMWDVKACDPCAADPLTPKELRQMGAYWEQLPEDSTKDAEKTPANSKRAPAMVQPWMPPWLDQPQSTFLTRLHVRYTPQTFSEDLMLTETKDSEFFQSRYVIRHPWNGQPKTCPYASSYFKHLRERDNKNLEQLSHLTGWSLSDISKRYPDADVTPASQAAPAAWWKDLWR